MTGFFVSVRSLISEAAAAIYAAFAASNGAALVGRVLNAIGAAPTNMQESFNREVHAVDFFANGANGARVDATGVIDSTAGIQAGINHLNSIGGGTLLLPPGPVKCGAIELKNNVNIVGCGRVSKLKAIAGTYNHLYSDAGGIGNVHLRDFYLDLNDQTGGNGIYIVGLTNSEISGVTLENAPGFGWLIFGSVNCRYRNNVIDRTRQWDGMTISTGSSNNLIEGNLVKDSYDSGIGFTDSIGTVCVGNRVTRSKVGGVWYAPGIDAAGAKNAVISGNYLIGNKFGISVLQHPNTGKQPKRIAISGNTIADGEYGVMCGSVVVELPAVSEAVTRDGININGNVIFSQDVEGIHIDGTIGCSIVGNIVQYCGTGIRTPSNDRLNMSGNLVSDGTTGFSLGSGNTNFSVFGNVAENNVTNWTGFVPGGAGTKLTHNKNGGENYSMSGHDAFTQAWDFPGKLQIGTFNLWIDGAGKLRMKNGIPATDIDGTIVGTQTA